MSGAISPASAGCIGRTSRPDRTAQPAASTKNHPPNADAAGGWKSTRARIRRRPGTGPRLHAWPAAAKGGKRRLQLRHRHARRLAPVPQGGAPPKRLLVQAGSFKSKANADKARSELAGLAPVDVAPIEVGGETYFRVRVGPFKGDAEASAALARVTQAGYAGAKIVSN